MRNFFFRLYFLNKLLFFFPFFSLYFFIIFFFLLVFVVFVSFCILSFYFSQTFFFLLLLLLWSKFFLSVTILFRSSLYIFLSYLIEHACHNRPGDARNSRRSHIERDLSNMSAKDSSQLKKLYMSCQTCQQETLFANERSVKSSVEWQSKNRFFLELPEVS